MLLRRHREKPAVSTPQEQKQQVNKAEEKPKGKGKASGK